MFKNGFIKLDRSILEWEWYDDINTKIVFIHLLLTVNIKDHNWHGMTIKRGSRVSSYAALAEELHLSVRNVRTSINHLESTGEVTRSSHAKFTVFTVNNYDKYQTVTRKTTNNRQTDDKQPTNNRQQYKNIKNNKEGKEEKEDIYFCAPDGAREKKFPLFERLWEEYPNKRNKYKVKDAQRRKIESIGYDDMHKAIESCINNKPYYQTDLINGDKFFNGGYEDYLAEEKTINEEKRVSKKKWE